MTNGGGRIAGLRGPRGLDAAAADGWRRNLETLAATRAPVRAPDARGASASPRRCDASRTSGQRRRLLTHDCRSAAESVGLETAVGFLHRDRPGRPSLALDLIEELRPVLADRLALSLVNHRKLRVADFDRREGSAVILKDDARRTVLEAWQERKKTERRHPFLDESAPLRLVDAQRVGSPDAAA